MNLTEVSLIKIKVDSPSARIQWKFEAVHPIPNPNAGLLEECMATIFVYASMDAINLGTTPPLCICASSAGQRKEVFESKSIAILKTLTSTEIYRMAE